MACTVPILLNMQRIWHDFGRLRLMVTQFSIVCNVLELQNHPFTTNGAGKQDEMAPRIDTDIYCQMKSCTSNKPTEVALHFDSDC